MKKPSECLSESANGPETIGQRPTEPATRQKLTLRQPDEILAMQFNDADIILGDRLFCMGQSLVVAGQGGLGKSRLLLQLAAAVVSRRNFLIFDARGSDLRWLILQVQNSNRRLKDDLAPIKAWLGEADWRRFNEQVIIHTIENDEDGFVSLESWQNRFAIEQIVQDTKPDIIAFDPLDEYGIGDLNKDSDMRETLTTLSRIFHKGNPQRGIIGLHHAVTGWAGAAKATGYDRASFARNSKALLAWTRGQINLAPVDEENYDRLIVACGKCSDGREFQTFAIRLNPETMIYECDTTVDVKAWAAYVRGSKDRRKPRPTEEQFLSMFMNKPDSPRTCLMSAVQLKEHFRREGWDESAAPALRDECEGAGKLEVYHGKCNQKLAGLPAMVQAFRKQQTEQSTILEQVPLTNKPKCKKRTN
jgi:hypothetical protein